MVLNPYVFARGDETTALVGQLIVERIFGNVPRIDIPLSVEQRLATNDSCIGKFAAALRKYGAAAKMSTASADPRILEAGFGSANILLRNEMDVLGIWRMVQHPRNYETPVGVFRYGSGGFYNETDYQIVEEDGEIFGYSTTQMNLSNIEPFARIAANLASEHKLKIMVCSKHTIAPSEAEFNKRVLEALEKSCVQGVSVLTDVAVATQATNLKGGVLYIMDNPNGDTGSDVIDWADGSRTMGSTLYCKGYIKYEELPGGTAPDLLKTDLEGQTFFNPMGTILAIGSAIVTANPDLKDKVDLVTLEGAKYVQHTAGPNCDTRAMIDLIASKNHI